MFASLILPDENATQALGMKLSQIILLGSIIHLKGELGAGKTTFVRGFLRGLGFKGKVKSPSFTLIEEYDFEEGPLFHFDLYRISDPKELEQIGIREYYTPHSRVIVEWAEKGENILPKEDLLLEFSLHNDARKVILSSKDPDPKIIQAIEAFKKEYHYE